ncbi:L,D-transpeptidase scaffold domain-containing protein [Thiohalobacter thiocyanaticus]|uniref:peptidoglycan-binding protein n=1 Tax=Thiohalobacter thiocyanaticus TaxID=585455 RepID=UPI00131A0F15|nr:peptidoglycan-binding protein [Thiohalobacter thiocyanaticus]
MPNIVRRLLTLVLLLTVWPVAAIGPDSVDLRNGIERFVTRAEAQLTCRGLDWEALQRFYSQRGYLPVWWDMFGRRPVPAAKELLAILEQSPEHGLSVSDYHLHELMALLPSGPGADLAQIDVLLTDAFLAYARHLYSGRNRPQLIDPAWHIEPGSLDAEALLSRVLENGRLEATLAALTPPHPEYRLLQDLLARYRSLAASGGWPVLESGPLLRPGERDLRVAPLRQRLWLEGFPVNWEGDEYLFDPDLEQTLKLFQQLRGIEPDGIVGPATLQALNVTATERI